MEKSLNTIIEILILISPFMYRSDTASCIRLCSNRTFDGTRQCTQVRNEIEERKRWRWLLQSHIFNIKILFFSFYLSWLLKNIFFRVTASTGMNDTSSRSHAIFTINFTQVSTAWRPILIVSSEMHKDWDNWVNVQFKSMFINKRDVFIAPVMLPRKKKNNQTVLTQVCTLCCDERKARERKVCNGNSDPCLIWVEYSNIWTIEL